MQEAAALFDAWRIWSQGGGIDAILAIPAVRDLAMLAAILLPSGLIAIGAGFTDLHHTPQGQWFGVLPPPDDAHWVGRASDLDKDGFPDF